MSETPLRDGLERLRAALVRIVGVDGREELEQLEIVLRLAPAPTEDIAAAIDGIHALLATLPELRADAAAPEPAPRRGLMVDRDADLRIELRTYLDTVQITSDNIGDVRRSLFMPWDSPWNGWVRDETASRENKVAEAPHA